MLRLPHFTYHRPASIEDAVALAQRHGRHAMFVAGGTDLYPNMKRRQQTPAHVIGLAGIDALHQIRGTPEQGITIGAMVTLSEIEHSPVLRAHHPAVATAAALVSTPLLRNMGTLGGNLLLDTRCTYYDQTHEWRQAIHFCLKKDGDTCWVAPGSPRCWAVQSSDSVPLLCAMDAEVTLRSAAGERKIPVRELYADDGIRYTTKQPGELLTHVHLPPVGSWRASYHKLRRRGTFDFEMQSHGLAPRQLIQQAGNGHGNARAHQHIIHAREHRAKERGQRGELDLLQVIDADQSGVTFLGQEHFREVGQHDEFDQRRGGMLGKDESRFEWLAGWFATRNEISIQRALRHAGNGKPRQRPAHIPVRIALLQSSCENHIQRRSRDTSELAQLGDSPGQTPVGDAGPHAALDDDRLAGGDLAVEEFLHTRSLQEIESVR